MPGDALHKRHINLSPQLKPSSAPTNTDSSDDEMTIAMKVSSGDNFDHNDKDDCESPMSPADREMRHLREENSRLRQEAAEQRIRPFLNEEEDEVIGWLYRPHTMTGLLLVIAVPIIVSVKIHSQLDQNDRMMRDRLGLLSVVSAFLGYCAFQMRDSILIRPHPMFWRMIHGMGILYLLFMIYLLNMDIHAARAWIRTFSPELKNEVAPPENTRIYATDCRLGTTGDPRGPFYVFWDTSFDIFFVAHFVGWIGKAIVFRDMKLTLTLSVMWEVVEYSFQHILGNFHECWWDHWILDVGLANLGGLLVGLYLNHRLEMRSYDWTGDFPHGQTPSPRHVTFSDVMTRLLQQFTPRSWDVYAWNVFSSVSRCMAVVALVFVAEMVELSGFFMKYILWVPPSNLLNTYRLLIWGFLTIPSVREWYAYINDSTVKRPGPNVWLAWFIIAIEYAFIFKHSEEWMGGAGGKDTPWEVMMGWGLFLLLGLTYIVSKFGPMHICKGLWSSTEYDTFRQVHAWATNALLCITFLPLAWMCYRLDVGYGTHYDSHIQHGYAPYFHYNGSQLATPHGHPRLVD